RLPGADAARRNPARGHSRSDRAEERGGRIHGAMTQSLLIAVSAALILSLALTPLVRILALRAGAVAVPKSDRWHRKPTAMLGGVAIFGAVVVPLLTFLP